MNKLRILKNNILSTAILSFAMFICLICTMLLLPIGITQLIGYERTEDLELYSEEIADYCVVNFPKYFYKELCKTFDMENFVGTADVGDYADKVGNYYSLDIVSEKAVKEMPALGYEFSKTKPKDYKEAYAPTNLRYEINIGDYIEVSCDKGVYEYKQIIKIIGFTGNDYCRFDYYHAEMSRYSSSFLIYDEIPPYAKVNGGLMLSDKSAEHYQGLGAEARTIRELNDSQKYSYSSNGVLYWSGSLFILLAIALAANYYFSVDKMTKRSGVMAIYGAKCSDIVFIELLKLILIFAVAFVLSLIFTAIMTVTTNETISWAAYFIGLGITSAIYVISVSFGFIKFARFKPLETLANNNVE